MKDLLARDGQEPKDPDPEDPAYMRETILEVWGLLGLHPDTDRQVVYDMILELRHIAREPLPLRRPYTEEECRLALKEALGFDPPASVLTQSTAYVNKVITQRKA